jgi:hypothetical protein
MDQETTMYNEQHVTHSLVPTAALNRVYVFVHASNEGKPLRRNNIETAESTDKPHIDALKTD